MYTFSNLKHSKNNSLRYFLHFGICFFIAPAQTLAAATGSSAQSISGLAREPSALVAFVASSLGKSVIVFMIFSGIALALRLLFGPKGLLREKRWDELNEEYRAAELAHNRRKNTISRLETLQEKFEPLLKHEGGVFSSYVQSFYTKNTANDELYRLKYGHSLLVLQNAWKLISGEEALQDVQTARTLLLAALYHDIGRFEQLRDYHTFMDTESIDHARAGSKRLADLNFLSAESPALRRAVRTAIHLHSRAELPPGLRKNSATSLALAARALRDADKLDIIRVMHEQISRNEASEDTVYLGLADRPMDYNPEAAHDALKGRIIRGDQMATRNDFRLRLCGWLNLFEFPTSLGILARTGYMEKIMAELPDDELMNLVRGMVRKKLEG